MTATDAAADLLGAPGEMAGSRGNIVRFRRQPRPGAPAIMLVHGGGAHKGWWLGVVPRLRERFDVVAVDLSGHGESDHTADYGGPMWADELAALVEHANLGPVIVVGHSMGGRVSLYFAARYPDLVDQLVLLDCPLERPRPGEVRRGRGRGPTRIYPTAEEAIDNFRLRPGDTFADAGLLRTVASMGLHAVPGGWQWRFDPLASQRFTNEDLLAELGRLRVPVGIVHGDRSPLVDENTVAFVSSVVGRPVPCFVVARAYHHVPLDNPSGAAAAIERAVDACLPPAR